MAGMAIDGLVSGMKTTEMISQLMQVEAAPQSLLRTKQTSASSLVSALQSLNTKVASLADTARTAAKPASWSAVTATPSAPSVTATVAAGAKPSSVSFTITSVASTQASLVTLPTSYDSATPVLTVTVAGRATDVTAASSAVPDVVDALNRSGTGVTAAMINIGTAAAPDYRVQVTGTASGAANTFTLAVKNPDASTTPLTLTEVRTAKDASITLWAGTPAAVGPITSPTNTFAGLMSGVDVTISAVEEKEVTVGVARNEAALAKLGADLVGNLNTVLSEITSRTKSSTTTAADGGSVVKGGIFSGHSGIRSLQQSIVSEATMPVDGVSPSTVGIVLNRDGTFTFDGEKFSAALRADPARVQRVVGTVAERVAAAASAGSDPTTGSVTAQITSQQGIVKDLGSRVADWDTRLERRRATLEKTYAALEVALSKSQSQSEWLSAQLAGLTAAAK